MMLVFVSFFAFGFLKGFVLELLCTRAKRTLKRMRHRRLLRGQTDAPTSDIGIPKLSSVCWKQFDKLPSSRKRKFLSPYLQTREQIYSYYDIQKGDHLVRTSSTMMGLQKFEHHFLCIGHNERGAPLIVHYNATKKGAFRRLFTCSLTHPSLARVNIMALPDYINEDNLQKQGVEVERVLWPARLRRYSVEKITWRALIRLGEAHYHVTENNCESFVMWCICNSNVSLQATPESIFALKIVPEISSEEGIHWNWVDCFIVFSLLVYLDVKILNRSLDSFHVLLREYAVKLPTFYAVGALYLTFYFLAKKYTLDRGKYLLNTWGNPIEYEKKLHENEENVVLKAAASLVTIIEIVISRDRGFRVFNSIFLSFFIGEVGGHLVGRLTCHLMQSFRA